MKKKLLLFSLLLLLSCSQNNSAKNNIYLADNFELDTFNGISTDTLKKESIDVELIAPITCKVFGDLFVVTHKSSQNTKYFLTIYNKKNFELIGQYITKGRAFNEVSGFCNLLSVIDKGETIEAVIHDIDYLKVKKFIIPKVSSDTCVIQAELIFDAASLKLSPIGGQYDIDNKELSGIFIDRENHSSSNYKKINFNSEVVFERELIKPEINFSEKTVGGRMAMELLLFLKPDKSKFVFWNPCINQINIYDFVSDKITAISILPEIPKCELLSQEDIRVANLFYYFGYNFCNDNLIMMSYTDDVALNKENKTFHIYDWSGKGKGIFTVENGMFAADMNEGVLYSIDPKTEELYRYDIKKYIQ